MVGLFFQCRMLFIIVVLCLLFFHFSSGVCVRSYMQRRRWRLSWQDWALCECVCMVFHILVFCVRFVSRSTFCTSLTGRAWYSSTSSMAGAFVRTCRGQGGTSLESSATTRHFTIVIGHRMVFCCVQCNFLYTVGVLCLPFHGGSVSSYMRGARRHFMRVIGYHTALHYRHRLPYGLLLCAV
ncbi:unnamed protein product [Prorocentrum cordatum]|uniref:Secreted peptide n=1 Tax=Prorocentrum cordatum TaxID=2364126 RepID=A0ABN9VMW2_9DINO|nr:unnamed protein product [Polarella glacialis]